MTSFFHKFRNRSLRGQILLQTLPVAILLFVLTSIYPSQRVGQEFRAQIESQIQRESVHLRELAQRKINTSSDACAAVAANDIVVNAVVDMEHRKSTLHSFIRSIRMPGAEVNNVVMTDYRGKVIASKQNASDENASVESPKWLPQVMQGEAVVSIDDTFVTFVHPVVYSGRPEAAIVSTYHVDHFFSDLCFGNETSFSGVSHNSRIIAASANQFVSPDHQLIVAEDWIAQTCDVESIPGLQVVVMNSSEFATQAINVVWMSQLIEMLGAIIVLGVGLWIATSLAIGAIDEFQTTINEVQENEDLSRRVDSSASIEFSRLGAAFNSMLDRIQKTTVSREAHRIPALVARYTDSAVVVTDARGVIEWVNEGFTRITGFSPEEALGRTPGSFLQGPKTEQAAVNKLRNAIRNKTGANVEILNYSKAGDEYWIDIELRPIHNEDGEVTRFIAIENDITERRRSEQENANLVRQMFELSRQAGKAEVATGVLHNVGNALNSVNVSADVISRRISNSKVESLSKLANILDERREDIEEFVVSPQGRLLPDVVRNLTDALVKEQKECHCESQTLIRSVEHIKQIVSKQQRDAKGQVLSEHVQLEELVDDAVRIRTPMINQHEVRLTKRFSEVPDVYADRHLVIQILVNLIGNAVNAVEENDETNRCIDLSIEEADKHHLRFCVTDNGVGISSDQMAKIFSHGFTTKNTGHGFGLHSSILAAESMSGTLTVESPGQGLGATFCLRLPTSRDKHPKGQKYSTASGSQCQNVYSHSLET